MTSPAFLPPGESLSRAPYSSIGKHDLIHKTGSIHNILHCSQKRTEPWPQVTRTESFVKFGDEICEQYFAPLPGTLIRYPISYKQQHEDTVVRFFLIHPHY